MKRYSWGFRKLSRVEVSVVTSDPGNLGEIKVGGKGEGRSWVAYALETGYDLDGHPLGTHATPSDLEAFITTKLGNLAPYATHPHRIPTVNRETIPGFVN